MAPNGQTATILDALVAPLVNAAFGAETQPTTGQARAEQRLEEAPPEEAPPQAPPEPAPDEEGESDGNDGGHDEEPDTDHGRKCAEYQRRLHFLEAEVDKWIEEWLFLSNNDITQLEGAEKARYLGLIRDYTGYTVPTEPPSAPPTPGQIPSPSDKKKSRRKSGRGIWELIPPLLEESKPIIIDPDWVQDVRNARDKAVKVLRSRQDKDNDRIARLFNEAKNDGCYPESSRGKQPPK